MSVQSEILNGARNLRNSFLGDIDNRTRSFISGTIGRSLAFGQMNIFEAFDMRRMVDTISRYDLLVGVSAYGSGRSREGEINNAELVYIHTHGVDKKAVRQNIQRLRQQGMNFAGARAAAHQMFLMTNGSPAYKIPPRPIIEPAIEANKEAISKKINKALQSFLNQDFVNGEKNLKIAGVFAQNKVRAWFTDSRNGWPPNSPYTIAKKNGKENPLIDTGQLRKSITYVVKVPDTRYTRNMTGRSRTEDLGQNMRSDLQRGTNDVLNGAEL